MSFKKNMQDLKIAKQRRWLVPKMVKNGFKSVFA